MRPDMEMTDTPMDDVDGDDENDNAYDAGDDNTFLKGDTTLDTPDVEDRAEKISAADIKKAERPDPAASIEPADDDIDVKTVSTANVKLLFSARTGKPNLVVRGVDGKPQSAEEVPPQYLELAKKHPEIALEKIRADKAAMMPAMDDELMESVRKDIAKELKKIRK